MAASSNTDTQTPLPVPNPFASQADGASTAATTGTVDLPAVPPPAPSERDFLIGGAVLLVLLVAFFFAKNAYATMLVGRRVEPRSANAAGWWLFVFLGLVATGGVLAAVARDALASPFIVGPLVLGALVALVLMVMSGRR